MVDGIDKPVKDLWRIFRVMAEFTEGFQELASVGPAVSIFGSARLRGRHRYYKLAEVTARKLAEAGFAVITGGGSGIMEAANKGASEAGGRSIGLNIELPQEQIPNDFQNLSLHFKYFFVRKVMFLKYAHGFIVFPGGYGTMDEFYDTITLIQTEKIHRLPVALMGKDFWAGQLEWIRKVMLERFDHISPADMSLFHLTDDPVEAVRHICEHLAPRDREPAPEFQKWDTPEGKLIP